MEVCSRTPEGAAAVPDPVESAAIQGPAELAESTVIHP